MWQVSIIIMPRVYKTHRTKLLMIIVIFPLLYNILLFYYSSFYVLHFGFVLSFCIIVIFWFDAFSLCSSKKIIQK